MLARRLLLAFGLFALPLAARAKTAACPQFFVGGRTPALLNPRLGQRTTLLCNDAYAVLASGVTRSDLVGRTPHHGQRGGRDDDGTLWAVLSRLTGCRPAMVRRSTTIAGPASIGAI